MRDAHLDPIDELASALLDGEATDDPRATDPAVLQRVEQLGAVARAVRTPGPSAPAPARDAAIAAAIEALDPAVPRDADTGTPVAAGPRWWQPGSMSPARLRVLGAAAAVLLVLAAVPVIGSLSSTSDDDTASVDPDAAMEAETFAAGDGADDVGAAVEDAAGPGDELREAAGTGPGSAAAGGGAGLVDLGAHDDIDGLAAAAGSAAGLDVAADEPDRTASPEPGTAAPPQPTAADDPWPCADAIEALDGPVLLVGTARLGTAAVVVAVLDRPEGPVMAVLDPEPPACDVVTELRL